MVVYHLKYRPQRIGELDLPEVGLKLKKILESEERPSTFLFTGPKGAGKTSAARILARAVNCLKPEKGEPCGKCASCQEIQNGSSLDVMEIDAASNRGIDDARSLRDKAVLAPVRLKTKVFIIDEVHMLTKEAFNALLKLLEEPPKNTLFILCTTDSEKIPETILSRLVRIDFRRGQREELLASLQKIIDGEGIVIDAEAGKLIAGRSDGSFRNINRTLNEIVVSYGKKISLDQVEEYYSNLGGGYSEEEMESDLAKGEVKIILEKLEKAANRGADFRQMRLRLIGFFQRKMLCLLGVVEGESKLSLEATKRLIELLIRAGENERELGIDQLPLELVMVDFLNSGDRTPVAKQVSTTNNQSSKKDDKKEEIRVSEKKSGLVGLDKVEKEWGNILKVVKPFNHSVEAFLRAARPGKVDGDVLTIEVFYPFHKDRLEEERNRKVVEKGLETVLGIQLQLKCELGKSQRTPLIIKNETPLAQVVEEKKDIYEVAKEIFG